MKKIIIAYIPVLHEGYRQFFEKHRKDADLYILGAELISEFTHLAKEIRQLDPKLIKKGIESWKLFENVFILDKKTLDKIIKKKPAIIIPKEDVMLDLWQKYFPKNEVFLDPIFLRWDKHNTVTENTVNPDVKISSEEFDKKMIALADEESEKSSDWWRRIGSIVVKDGKIILKMHNHHLPSDHAPYANGDPRNNFHKGIHFELSTSIHSEAALIAEAAKKGISLEGADIYLTTFPCPPCAKLIACSGIKKMYYKVGYGMLDGESVLKQFGVEIIQVEG
jgi:dCMP deaminase